MINYRKFMESFVKELGFGVIEDLNYGPHIFKASRNDLAVTVKFGVGKSFAAEQAETENRALDITRGIDGVVEKMSFHELGDKGDGELVAILRHYVEGEELGCYDGEWDEGALVNTVNALHEHGLTCLDLEGNNVIIDPSQKPLLIDLGICNFREDYSNDGFGYEKKRDLDELKKLLRRYGEHD